MLLHWEIELEIIDRLKQQAKEIADAGHAGWGNTMLNAAEELERLSSIISSSDDITCDYLCKKCSHPYNVEAGKNEDCPRCGYDGT